MKGRTLFSGKLYVTGGSELLNLLTWFFCNMFLLTPHDLGMTLVFDVFVKTHNTNAVALITETSKLDICQSGVYAMGRVCLEPKKTFEHDVLS